MTTPAIEKILSSYQITTQREADGALWAEVTSLEGKTYQTRVAGQFSSDGCTCPGFARRGKCKHVEALRELRWQQVIGD